MRKYLNSEKEAPIAEDVEDAEKNTPRNDEIDCMNFAMQPLLTRPFIHASFLRVYFASSASSELRAAFYSANV